MNGKENQRVMLTKRLIKESLIRLLADQSIYKVSVRGLCEDAGINRSTFYKHYGSQYDVLTEMEADLLRHVQKALEAAAPDDKDDMARQVETVCAYLEANAAFARLLVSNNIDPNFSGRLFSLPKIKQLLNERLSGRYDEESRACVITFVINGSYHLIREWISRDERKPAGEIAALVLELADKVC